MGSTQSRQISSPMLDPSLWQRHGSKIYPHSIVLNPTVDKSGSLSTPKHHRRGSFAAIGALLQNDNTNDNNIYEQLMSAFNAQCEPVNLAMKSRSRPSSSNSRHERSHSVSSVESMELRHTEILCISSSLLWSTQVAKSFGNSVMITQMSFNKKVPQSDLANCRMVGDWFSAAAAHVRTLSFDFVRLDYSLLTQPTHLLLPYFKQLFNQVRAGGYIECFESNFLFHPNQCSSRLDVFTNVLREKAFDNKQIRLYALSKYAEMLYEAGFVQVDMKCAKVEVNTANIDALGSVWEGWGVEWRRVKREVALGGYIEVWSIWARKPIWQRRASPSRRRPVH